MHVWVILIRVGRAIALGFGSLLTALRAVVQHQEPSVSDPILLDGWDLPPNQPRPPRPPDS